MVCSDRVCCPCNFAGGARDDASAGLIGPGLAAVPANTEDTFRTAAGPGLPGQRSPTRSPAAGRRAVTVTPGIGASSRPGRGRGRRCRALAAARAAEAARATA
jgi:hypothetical protein